MILNVVELILKDFSVALAWASRDAILQQSLVGEEAFKQ